jgi:uncharacterized protein involved in outer membrane biogenesis
VLTVLVAVYAAAGFWLAPKLVRSQAQDFVSEHYKRTLSVGEIRFNPFTFELEVRDLSLPDADGQVLASFDRLLVNLELSSIWRAGASLKEISIDRPFGRVLIRKNGDLNLADLFRPFPETPENPAEPEEPPRLFIDLFRMTEGHVNFTDRTLSRPYSADLQPLTIELRDFSTRSGSDNAYDLHAEAGSGASLDWSGNFALAPLASKGRFKFTHINAKAHWAYVREAARLDVSSGVLGFDGDYDLFIGKAGTELKVALRELGIDDIGIRPIGQDVDTAHFERLTLSNANLDLAKHTVGVEKVLVTGGSVQAWREANGDINLTQLTRGSEAVAPPADPTAAAPAAEPESPWLVTAPEIELTGLVMQVEDRQVEPAIKLMLDPFHVRVTGYSTAPGTTIGIVTDTKIDKTGSLEADLKYGLDDRKLAGNAKLAAFDMTVIQPYLDRYTKMDLLSGHLTADLNVLLNSDGGLATDGVVQIDKFRTVDKAQQEDFLKWHLLRAEGISYDGRTAELHIKNLKTRGAYARVIIAKDETINVAEIFTAEKPAPAYKASIQYAAAEGPPPAETQIKIDTVSFDNGSLNFADFWIQPNYAVSIASLQGTVVGLSTDPNSRAKLDLEGKVDRYAPATIDGEMNLLSATLYTDIRLKFDGVDMTSVTPYSGHFAGYKIEKGKLSVDVTYHVENRALDAKQKFVIDQLQLGDKVESPDAVSLPLKLAVALLKDKNGVIDIDLPMTGSLDDPKFRLGPLIWKAFVGLLTKIATAPFALIGSLFGGGPELSYVEFEPGIISLDPAGQEKMATLMKALVDRPSLQVDVPMAYSAELDGELIAKQSLDASLTKLAGSQRKLLGGRPDAEEATAMLADPERRFELLAKQYRAEAGEKAPLPGAAATFEALKKKERTPENLAAANKAIEDSFLEQHPVTTEQLEALGKARAQSIQEALLGGGQVDPGRVFLIHADSQPPGESKVKLELSLK